MIYTVTFNPSLDYIVSVEKFRTGKINRTINETIYPGGKGINVSMVLGNLGIESRALGFCAGFTGDELKRLLDEKNVRSDFICVNKGMTRINVKLYSDEGQQGKDSETEINGQGPFIQKDDIEKLYSKLDKLSGGDILVLAGSIPNIMPSSIYMDIMEHLQDKKLKIVVDATKDLLVNVLKYRPFLIKPNNHELGEIFNTKIENKDEAVKYAKKLQEMGALNVLVSMAGEGAVLVSEKGSVYKMDAPKGKVINSVGAGDSMVAGFIAGFLEKNDLSHALKMGICAGSASAFSSGLATREGVERLMN